MAQSTDKTLSNLIINRMPQSVYDAKKAAGELSDDELYLTPSKNSESWEYIGEIDFTTDAAANIHSWVFDNLPGYTKLFFDRNAMGGSTATASGVSTTINNSGASISNSALSYAKQGATASGWTLMFLVPDENLVWIKSGDAANAGNHSIGGVQTCYCATPCGATQITKLSFSDNSIYPITTGKLKIWGKK